MDRSLQRMQAQRAMLAKRVIHQPIQLANLPPDPVIQPRFAPRAEPTPTAPGASIGAKAQPITRPEPLRWKNTDHGVVRSAQENSGYRYVPVDPFGQG